MQKITILIADTNDMLYHDLLTSPYLDNFDLKELNKFTNNDGAKEKAISIIMKKKLVGNYSIDENGKPINPNIYFNISHSNGFVVFTKDKYPIGIDIEKIRESNPRLIEYISSKEEQDYIKDDKSFFEIWTNKESLGKAIGVGVFANTKEIPALPINGVKRYQNKDYYSKSIQYKDFIISVAREGLKNFELEIKNFDFE